MAASTLPAPALLTMEEYLATSYRPDCDFVDGVLEERNVGEYEHSTIQIALGAWFFNRRKDWAIRVASEYRTRVAPRRVRIPDISVFADEGPAEKVRVTPPLLAVEILSPEDRMNRVSVRLNDFLAMGVPNVWLIDPLQRTASNYSTGDLVPVASRLVIPNSPIYLDLAEIFSALD